MTGPKQVRMCGFGGQGIVLAGTVLGRAAVDDGKWAAGSSSYGAQARGGYCRSDVLISDDPIVFPHVIEADILIAMAQTAYDQYREDLASDAIVLFDEKLVTPKPSHAVQQIGVPATNWAIKELGEQQVANMVLLGATVAITQVVDRKALLTAIRDHVGERFRELNVKAINGGFALGEERWQALQELTDR